MDLVGCFGIWIGGFLTGAGVALAADWWLR